MQNNRNSNPFKEPVDPAVNPNYYNIVKDPMGESPQYRRGINVSIIFCLDLQIIEGKVNYNEYGCLADFIGDVTRIFENCRYFNQEGSNVAKSAQNLEQFLAKQIVTVREKMATLDQWNIPTSQQLIFNNIFSALRLYRAWFRYGTLI